MKNVLLPTDLTVQSLRPVHDIAKGAKGEEITVLIVHLISPPTSITELLFITQNKPFRDIPENFKDALQLLRCKYRGLLTIVFDFVYCNTSRYFNNFIEGNSIDEVYLLSNYRYREILPQSENPLRYLNKCKVKLHKLGLQGEATSEYQNLSALLNGGEQIIKAPELNRAGKTTISYS
jgi:hypothetical protein